MRGRGTPIELDKVRYLRYTAEAMEDFEETMGYGIFYLIEQASNENAVHKFMEIKPIRVLLQAGLKHEDPQLADKKLGKRLSASLIDTWIQSGKSIPELYTVVLNAVRKDQWPTMDTTIAEPDGDGDTGE